MEDFWKSVQTIQAERGADYRAFSLFSATHWAELLGAAAVIFLCAVIYYRCREVTRHQILRAVDIHTVPYQDRLPGEEIRRRKEIGRLSILRDGDTGNRHVRLM